MARSTSPTRPTEPPNPRDVETYYTDDEPTELAPRAPIDPHAPPRLPERYVLGHLLGRGGMGEVWRVHDRVLDRDVALKVLQLRRLASPNGLARFQAEARLTARLHHPGVVPVHDLGYLHDGRWWYTMEEVSGVRLDQAAATIHATGGPLRRAVDLLYRACQAVAHAHQLGVIHRDLKPDNILVGAHGDVRAVDWGVARVLGAGAEDLEPGGPTGLSTSHTGAGTIVGTPRYMSPEQARGDTDLIGPPADVFALGVVLGEILEQWAPPPPDLSELKARATHPDIAARPQDADALAAELAAWLDGALQRERALAAVAAAVSGLAAIPHLRAEAARLDALAAARRSEIPSWAPIEHKRPIWELEDQAAARRDEAARLEVDDLAALQAAFALSPDLPEAHAALADWYQARHAEAEARQDVEAAAAHERRLRHHDREGRYTDWLRGDGALTLVTDPPCEAEIHRYTMVDRRLVPIYERTVTTPVHDLPLPMGSWLLVLKAPGRPPVRYPVHIGRQERWNGVRPGSSEPLPISLPQELGPDEVYAPAGPAWIGGDPEANNPLSRRRLWFDAVVARRFPVTNREYLAFLNDLVARGEEEAALNAAPRERAARLDEEGALLYGRDEDGRFLLQADADGDIWDLDWPVFHVDWRSAHAYSAWLSARTGQRWRLPGDLELERLSRGVDGRVFPWGDHLDPTLCLMLESHRGRPMPAVVDSYPTDESPFGVRGVAGNIRVFCLDLFTTQGPPSPDGIAPPPVDPGDDPGYRVTRCGDWYGPDRLCRCANRGRDWPQVRVSILGFRLVRDP